VPFLNRGAPNVKTAVISDIHANLEALRAVLEHADAAGAESLICLGDVVGYNADPAACVDLLRSRPGLRCLLGNHDAMAVDDAPIEGINPMAHAAITWTRDQLDAERKAWLRALPLVIEDDDAVYCHASLDDPGDWRYVKTMDAAVRHFAHQKKPVGFIGHSHVAFAWRERDGRIDLIREAELDLALSERWLISVGSVGQPRDHDARAAYVMFDTEARSAIHVRVDYDVAAAQRKILDAGLPARLAERLG